MPCNHHIYPNSSSLSSTKKNLYTRKKVPHQTHISIRPLCSWISLFSLNHYIKEFKDYWDIAIPEDFLYFILGQISKELVKNIGIIPDWNITTILREIKEKIMEFRKDTLHLVSLKNLLGYKENIVVNDVYLATR